MLLKMKYHDSLSSKTVHASVYTSEFLVYSISLIVRQSNVYDCTGSEMNTDVETWTKAILIFFFLSKSHFANNIP